MKATTSQPLAVAVALAWDGDGAPKVSAKGRGELAARIAALAREHGVPIDSDPHLVEVLAQVELGQPVPETLFRAVAQVIAFAYRVRGRVPVQRAPRDDPPAPR